jgi:hypothetical protein
MRIHTNTLSHMHIVHAFQEARAAGHFGPGVTIDITGGASRSHLKAFTIALSFDRKIPGDGRRFGNSGPYGAVSPRNGYPDIWAATYDEWGWLPPALFDRDPSMVVGSVKNPVYRDRADFDARTGLTYNPAVLLPLLVRGHLRDDDHGDPYPATMGVDRVGRRGYGRIDADTYHEAAVRGRKVKHNPRTPVIYATFANVATDYESIAAYVRKVVSA